MRLCLLISLMYCISVTSSLFLSNILPTKDIRRNENGEGEEVLFDRLKRILYGNFSMTRWQNRNKAEYRRNPEATQNIKRISLKQVNNNGKAYRNATHMYYKKEPVLEHILLRRASDRRKRKKDDSNNREVDASSISSSSMEMKNTKEEAREAWLHKKHAALNNISPKGDVVNLLAARPWGVTCGDPNQYDLPWGQCMLETECEPEFRIYRADQACGRTIFVCCALKVDMYDMNQPFDLSLGQRSSEASNTDEKRDTAKSSKEKRKRLEKRQKRKRKKLRNLRKTKIRKRLKKIIRDVTDIFESQTRNSTRQRRKQSQVLKKFLSNMKNQFRLDRKKIANLDEVVAKKSSDSLMGTLQHLKKMNEQFVSNLTFRDIVVNGTVSKQKLRAFLDANPQLEEYILHPKNTSMRRFVGGSRVFSNKLKNIHILKQGKYNSELAKKLKDHKNRFIDFKAFINNGKPTNEVSLDGSSNNFQKILKHLYRRTLDRKKDSQLSDISSSSSVETRDWKQELREKWLHKKFEAYNGSRSMEYWPINGPWGTVCGDPNQMDVPWGQCLPEPECDSEFRIYRGDYACGRSLFVCCAIKGNMEDMNRGLDLSLIDSLEASASVDKITNDREKRKRREARDKKKRTKLRILQKKKFKHSIKLVTKEVAELLAKQSRNSTRLIRKKVKALKAILKGLKQQFRTDRQKILNDMQNRLTVDNSLIKQLNEMKEMNEQFVSNMTFRDIVVNGRVSNKALQMLLRAYPELYNETARRSAGESFVSLQNQDSVSREYYIE